MWESTQCQYHIKGRHVSWEEGEMSQSSNQTYFKGIKALSSSLASGQLAVCIYCRPFLIQIFVIDVYDVNFNYFILWNFYVCQIKDAVQKPRVGTKKIQISICYFISKRLKIIVCYERNKLCNKTFSHKTHHEVCQVLCIKCRSTRDKHVKDDHYTKYSHCLVSHLHK